MEKEKENAKQKLPFVEFVVEGVPGVYAIEEQEAKGFRLTYDYNEICDAENLTGLNLLSAMRNLDAMSAGQMRAVLLALLKSAHPKTTLPEAGKLLSNDRESVIEALRKALKVKSSDEVVLDALARIAAENPQALVDMLAAAGIVFEVKSAEQAPAPDAPPVPSADSGPVQ